jgi:hypothetical protein
VPFAPLPPDFVHAPFGFVLARPGCDGSHGDRPCDYIWAAPCGREVAIFLHNAANPPGPRQRAAITTRNERFVYTAGLNQRKYSTEIPTSHVTLNATRRFALRSLMVLGRHPNRPLGGTGTGAGGGLGVDPGLGGVAFPERCPVETAGDSRFLAQKFFREQELWPRGERQIGRWCWTKGPGEGNQEDGRHVWHEGSNPKSLIGETDDSLRMNATRGGTVEAMCADPHRESSAGMNGF